MAAGTLTWAWLGLHQATGSVWTCPDETIVRNTPVNAKEKFTMPYQPDPSGVVTFHRVVTGDNFNTTEYTVTLTPLE